MQQVAQSPISKPKALTADENVKVSPLLKPGMLAKPPTPPPAGLATGLMFQIDPDMLP